MKTKEAKAPTIDEAAAAASAKEIGKEMIAVKKQLEALPKAIEDEDDYKVACALLVGIVEKRKWLDEQRSGFLEDAHDYVARLEARVDKLFAAPRAQAEEMESFFRGLVAEYAKTLDGKANGLRIAAAKLPARDEERARKMLEQAEETHPPKVGGISITTKESVEIVNEKHLPEKFFKRVVDEKLLLACLARGEVVPGAKLVIVKGVRVTPAHAKKEA